MISKPRGGAKAAPEGQSQGRLYYAKHEEESPDDSEFGVRGRPPFQWRIPMAKFYQLERYAVCEESQDSGKVFRFPMVL